MSRLADAGRDRPIGSSSPALDTWRRTLPASRPSRTSTSSSSRRSPSCSTIRISPSLLTSAPCDVAVSRRRRSSEPGPVLVPFAGAEHDWSAIELGAWLAGSWSRRSASPARPSRAAGTRAGCWQAPRSRCSVHWVSPPSRCSSSPAPMHSPRRPATSRSPSSVSSDRWREGGPRASTKRAGRKRSADAAGAQGPPTWRSRSAGEPHPLHVVAQGRLISASPIAAGCSSCTRWSPCPREGRRVGSNR